jgi:hypothetical protein
MEMFCPSRRGEGSTIGVRELHVVVAEDGSEEAFL